MPFFGQELFVRPQATEGLADPDYMAARAKSLKLATGAIEGVLAEAKAEFYVAPTTGRGVAERPGARRYRRRTQREFDAGDRGLAAPDRADGDGRRPAGRIVVHRPREHGGDVVRRGLAFEQAANARVAPTYAASRSPDPTPSRRSSNSARMWIARSDRRTSTMNAASAAISSAIATMNASATQYRCGATTVRQRTASRRLGTSSPRSTPPSSARG